VIAFDELKTDYKNPIDQCNSLNPVSGCVTISSLDLSQHWECWFLSLCMKMRDFSYTNYKAVKKKSTISVIIITCSFIYLFIFTLVANLYWLPLPVGVARVFPSCISKPSIPLCWGVYHITYQHTSYPLSCQKVRYVSKSIRELWTTCCLNTFFTFSSFYAYLNAPLKMS